MRKLSIILLSLFTLFVFSCSEPEVSVQPEVPQTNNPSQESESKPGKLSISSESSFIIPGEEISLKLSSSDGKDINNITWSVSNSSVIKGTKQNNTTFKIKGLKKGSSTITAVESGTNRRADFAIDVKEAYINITRNNIAQTGKLYISPGESVVLKYEIKATASTFTEPFVIMTISGSDYFSYFDINHNSDTKTITIKAKNTEAKTFPDFTLSLKAGLNSDYTIVSQDVDFTIKAKDTPPSPTEPENNGGGSNGIKPSEKYTVKVILSGHNNDIFTPFYVGDGITLDVRIFDEYLNNPGIKFLEYKLINTNDISDKLNIKIEAKLYSDKVEITPKSGFTSDIQLKFYDHKGGTEYAVSELITLKPGKDPTAGGGSGGGSSGGGSGSNKPGPIIPGGGSGGGKPQFEIGKPVIIPHDYEHEKVYWLGGIETPTQFEDYKSIGNWEEELDEFGQPTGNMVQSSETVPNYYVVDYSKMDANGKTPATSTGKPTWYNVTKSMYLPDFSMCWAMASAGAMQWWFDYLGEDYTQKLFEIRRNRTDMPKGNSSAKFLLDEMSAKDIHYNPLPKESDGPIVAQKSGIGRYAIKSFGDIGGEPMDLFRLYFLDENKNTQSAAHLGSQYINGRSIGLLHGMNASFSGWLDGTDYLYQKFSISNMRKDDIVNMFKTAIKEEAAIVLHQANLPDNVLGDNGPGAKAHHAIILWGVIFDAAEENIVGLYIGDNNLKEGNLARVDLAFKQLSKDGGRYYYASPFVKQDNPQYVKSTSINSITKLYPPKDRVKNWIDDKYKELGLPKK